MKSRAFCIFIVLLVAGCSSFKVVELDPSTGYFPVSSKAQIVSEKPLDLDTRKNLLLVPKSDFVKGMIKNIAYFDELVTFDELEKQIIAANLTSKIPAITDRIGLSNAAKNYKSFMWLHFDTRGEGRSKYSQIVLTDPLTMEDYLIAETYLDFRWSGVNDQNNWYPMLNSLVDYIKKNSKTYRR
jgi:hypothetical protein